MLVDNINLIKSRYPQLWTELVNNKDRYEVASCGLEVEQSKSGMPTLSILEDDRKLYFHSKYNPLEESSKFIEKYEDIEEYEHLFFYGLGLGYHLEALMNKHPDKLFTIYEPNPAVIYKYLESKRLDSLPIAMLRSIFIEWNPEVAIPYLQHFLANYNGKTLLVTNNSYERIFPNQVSAFNEQFKKVVHNQRSNLGVNQFFERNWTINSLLNFNKILETPNIVLEKKDKFKGKPAILVAAGPSLEDEIDNLKHIKKHGLAYIIAVGSANKALLKNGIHPDAVTSYDPWTAQEGLDVFSDITEQGITTIPLIFGSTVGFNAVTKYTGTLMHMFINQDTVSPYYLGRGQINDTNSMLADAPSIAVITMQLLIRLECNPVILVGQNFAYRNNQHYAAGIGYSVRPTHLSEQELQGLITVKGVEGEDVFTTPGFDQGNKTMSQYIKSCPEIEVMNATRGGARIEGTTYKSLESIMDERLRERVVEADWYKGEFKKYDTRLVKKHAREMEKEFKGIGGVFDKMVAQFKVMERLMKTNESKKIEQQLVQFDKTFNKFKENKYYIVFIQPMLRNQHQVLMRTLSDIRNTSDHSTRAKKVIESFGRYIYECQKEMKLIHYDFARLQQQLLNGQREDTHIRAN